MKRYQVKELFYSVQGEGARAGTANVFVRFAGCNMRCTREHQGFDCDTDFRGGRSMTAEEIVHEACCLTDDCGWVILTGGEPALQLDAELLERFQMAGWSVAIETNGTLELPPGIDWVTVSPKTPDADVKQRTANEVKCVVVAGQPLPDTKVQASIRLLSPAFAGDVIDQNALAWCVELVKENPEWRLSVQQHKAWGVK